uniref:Tubulinspecific chaperone E putative n=1 Tax=Albugo laibachii Nc14 TaxID=890382 RepID=F0W1Q8_9STRA|nr:tubulinspecific chaperone E putative [Albugo laibachii Nc14]|eukprot:CCA14987.1 tubulinspecific chaperone E putative [Albugo laibachii Nc14]
MSELIRIGDRIQDAKGDFGTIRYIGPIVTSKDPSAIHYGIEWDNECDEKNREFQDGSIVDPSTNERIHYFTKTKHHSCSFLEASNMEEEGALQRQSLIQALFKRYAVSDSKISDATPQISQNDWNQTNDVVVIERVPTCAKGTTKPIELVGAQKIRSQQKLEVLEQATLVQSRIDSIGIESDLSLRSLTPKLQELNLSFNLLHSWQEILEILQDLPSLKILNLNGNRLHIPDSKSDSDTFPSFPELKVLALNQTMIPWKILIDFVVCSFPLLEELYFCENRLQDEDFRLIPDLKSHLPCLRVLDLSNNAISTWSILADNIGPLPVLSNLILNDTKISTLVTPPKPDSFQKLKTLSITNSQIDSWRSIDALNEFPVFETLRFNNAPLIAPMSLAEARMLIIARVGNLKQYNGSQVLEKERQDDERMYLQRIWREITAIKNLDSSKEIIEQEVERVVMAHPRFAELKARYPDLLIPGSTCTHSGGDVPASRGLIRLKFTPMSMLASSFDSFEKKIPEEMPMHQLKTFIFKQTGVPTEKQRLTFRTDPKSMPLPMEEDDYASIAYFGLQDGMEILINDYE